jgi:hypothetical protein
MIYRNVGMPLPVKPIHYPYPSRAGILPWSGTGAAERDAEEGVAGAAGHRGGIGDASGIRSIGSPGAPPGHPPIAILPGVTVVLCALHQLPNLTDMIDH